MIDTVGKRFSMMGFDSTAQIAMVPPRASIDAGARQALLWLYAMNDGGVAPPDPGVMLHPIYFRVSVGTLMN